MKRMGGWVLLIGGLTIVVAGLGVRWSRTNRHDPAVVQSPNRTDPPKGPKVHDGSGAASSESHQSGDADPSTGVASAQSKPVVGVQWTEFRKAVMAGDAARLRGLDGKVELSDAATLYALFSEIPVDVSESDRKEISLVLARLLRQIKTEECSAFLLTLVRQGVFQDEDPRSEFLWELGNRKYQPAAADLERAAFVDMGLGTTVARRRERCSAMTALMLLDPPKYLPQVSDALRTVADSNLWCVVLALQGASGGGVDITPAVPDLQSKFSSISPELWPYKIQIGQTLAEYANSSKPSSASVKTWLMREVQKILDSQSGLDEASLEAYRSVLKQMNIEKAAK